MKKGMDIHAVWIGLVVTLVAALVIMLFQGKTFAAGTKSITECKTQGGKCADEIEGNSGTLCPDEGEGFHWAPAGLTCKRPSGEFQCCKKATQILPGMPDYTGVPGAPGTPGAVVVPGQKTQAEEEIRAYRGATPFEAMTYILEATTLIESGSEGALLPSYDTAKLAIYGSFGHFKNDPAQSKNPDEITPLTYASIKGFEIVSRVAEYYHNRKKMQNPYGPLCKMWAMMYRGYAEGYWSEAKTSYTLSAFYNEVKRRLSQPQAEAEKQPYCQMLLNLEKEGGMAKLKACELAMTTQRASVGLTAPPAYTQLDENAKKACDSVLPLLKDDAIDLKRPDFVIQQLLAELDALLQPLRKAPLPMASITKFQEEATALMDNVDKLRKENKPYEETDLRTAYAKARLAIVGRFAIYAEDQGTSPFDYNALKSVEVISRVAELLHDEKRIQNPYERLCWVWALMVRGRADDYWDDNVYKLHDFHAEMMRRLNKPNAGILTQSPDKVPACNALLGITEEEIMTCQKARGEAFKKPDAEYLPDDTFDQCPFIYPLFLEEDIDYGKPYFDIEPLFAELDTIKAAP